MKMRYRKGEFLTADTANRLIAATLANTPRDGLGTRVVRGASGGFSIDITQPKGRGRASAAPSHPWKVRNNGDGTATISAGKILGIEYPTASTGGTLPTFIHLKEFYNYTGGDVTVTEAGKIYASVEMIDGSDIYKSDADPGSGLDDLSSFSIGPYANATLSVAFAPTLPTTGTVCIFEIATVTLDDLDVVVDQILTHNPQLTAWASATPGSPA